MIQPNINLVDATQHETTITTDTLLLADFISLKTAERVLEIGTGSGAISLILAEKNRVDITGIDISPESIHVAQKNLMSNKSKLAGDVTFLQKSVESLKEHQWNSYYDVVVCNPPFYKSSEGRSSPVVPRRMAREEMRLSLHELIRSASFLLRHKGRLYLIHRPERLEEIMETGRKSGIHVKEIQPVYTKKHAHAKRVLIMAQNRAKAGAKILQPRYI